MVTLKDIADKAGVSVMTVSRVINGHYSKVSDEKIERIQKIIRESKYVPNSLAHSLSSRSSRIIAVIVQGTGNCLVDPYVAAIVGQIINLVQEQGYFTMVHYIENYEDITAKLCAWNAEGAIFLGTYDEEIKKIQDDNHIPLVFLDNYSSYRQIINIGLDDYKGGSLAAAHFIEQGHRSFAFVCYSLQSSGVTRHRLSGFRTRLEENGFELPEEHILDINMVRDIGERIKSFDKPATAFFATADMAAISLMKEMEKANLYCPRDFSVIGFDDLPLSSLITPKLTTIAQDIERKAQFATKILFRHIEDRGLPAENVCLDVHLVERQSVRSMNKVMVAR